MQIKKKVLVTAIATAGAAFGTSVSAIDTQTLDNDATKAPFIVPGGTVTAESISMTETSTSTILTKGTDFIRLQLPTGFTFASAPTVTASVGASGGLLVGVDEIGSTIGTVTLSGASGNTLASVAVNKSFLDAESVTWSNIKITNGGTSTSGDVKATMLVTDSTFGTEYIQTDIIIAKKTTAINSPLDQQSATATTVIRSKSVATNVSLGGNTSFLLSIPAQAASTNSDSLTLKFSGTGVVGAAGTGTTLSITTLTDGAPTITKIGPGFAIGANTATLQIASTGLITNDAQYLVTLDNGVVNTTATAAVGVVTLGTAADSEVSAGAAGDTLLTFANSGSTASGGTAVTLVRGTDTEVAKGTFTITENFLGDISTGTITLTPSTGLVFDVNSPITAASKTGDHTFTEGSVSAGSVVITVDTNSKTASNVGDVISITGLKIHALSTSADTATITVGKSTDTATNTPDTAVTVASVKDRGGVEVASGSLTIAKVGPSATGQSAKVRVLEGTYGAINKDNTGTGTSSFIQITGTNTAKISTSTVAFLAGTDTSKVTATGLLGDDAFVDGSTTTLVNTSSTVLDIQTASAAVPADGSLIHSLGTESSQRRLVEFTVGYDVSTTAVVGDQISINIGGNAGIDASIAVSEVSLSTTSSSSAIPAITTSTDAKSIATFSITEVFASAATFAAKSFRVVAPTGFVISSGNATGTSGTATGVVSTTFNTNDTITFPSAGITTSTSIDSTSVSIKAVITADAAAGKATFSIVDGDVEGKNTTGLVNEDIVLAYIGTVETLSIPTTATAAIGFDATLAVTGGLAPYAVSSATTANATAAIDGATVTVTGVAAGTSVITVTDDLKKTDTSTVTVSAGATQPDGGGVALDGSTTDVAITGGVSSDGGVTFDGGVTVGDAFTVVATINPDTIIPHVGEDLNVFVVVEVVSTGDLIALGPDGLVTLGDGVAIPTFLAVTAAGTSISIDIFKSLTLTEAEVGDYNIFTGYTVDGGDGTIYYSSTPIALTVGSAL